MTRALKNTMLQQHMIPVDKALQILNEESPPLVVDRDRLKVCEATWNFAPFDSFFFFFFQVKTERGAA